MKHTCIVFLVLFVFLAAVSAADTVPVDVSQMNDDDALSYMFLYGYEAIMEELCKGCFLAIDEDLSYLGGWRTPQTPEDFAVNIPASAIAIPQVLPKGLAMTMFTLLGDYETSAAISGIKGPGIYAVCIFLPEKGMTVGDPTYNHGQKLLENELARHGLNPSEFYAFMEGQGVTLDMMVATMYRGDATAQDIVLDGMGMMEALKTDDGIVRQLLGPHAGLIVVLILAFIAAGFIVLAVILITGKRSRLKVDELEKEARREEHNNSL